MALKTTVYVTGIANLTDARYCAGMGVDYLGFNFDENLNPVLDKDTFYAITGWLAGVKVVAECGNMEWELVEEVVRIFQPQVVATSNLDVLNKLAALPVEPLLAWAFEDMSDEFLDAIKSENGEQISLLIKSDNWKYPDDFNEEHIMQLTYASSIARLLLGFKADADHLAELIDTVQPAGVMLRGSGEIRPGVSELDELAEFLEMLEDEDY